MTADTQRTTVSFGEFVALMGTMTALIALSIDMMLPALPDIAATLGVRRANDGQLIVSLLFLGFGFGQFFYGPISESVGRKPAVYVGLALFSAGCLLALVAQTFPVMLVGRVLQGVGVGGPRAMTIALVRDRFEGRAMARVMSLVMAVFILVPVIAPSIGQAILRFAGWRTIFGVYLTLGLLLWVWFAWRQEETLAPERRLPFSLGNLARGAREVFGNRLALGYTAAAGVVYGAFIGYLSSVQQILQQQYALGPKFPLYFATLAVALGGASLCNARLVGHYGMRPLAGWALRLVCAISVIFLTIVASWSGHPPLSALIAFLLVSFFGIGLLMGNLNALAMQPLGHIAGIGAAVVGGSQTLISLACGTVIGQSYDNTVLPLVAGFAILSGLAMAMIRVAEGSEPGNQMRVVVFGNSGSGKSTYARGLSAHTGTPHLDLDTIVWEPDQVAVPRPAEAIRSSLEAFLAGNSNWVVEGCYGELVEAAASRATELVFLNPGLDACIANNTRRPWEPHKYASLEQQNSMLEKLQAWVADYYHRQDQWSYAAHRRIFDAHRGPKVEHTSAATPRAI